ncbi:M13 family metallopeptidase [Lacimicrobium alkaliphilum]|uniref:Zinc metalloprotease n=1 Tax=Lacimicrobium alkaliphilum TaxID=1526571 RepID=A0ABQ1R024_9ALTE|nr:M13 family metallopeptidase [Lacimicrobium alkaliphilum]GGD53417.1 zinc metalloprotease [Lacimicrobium alkaliphilum]
MRKTLVATMVASALTLGACKENTAEQQTDKAEATVTKASTQSAAPEMGTFGVELSARDESVKPGDDFFMYASGTWYENFQMPADKTRYGAFTALADRSEEQVKAIVEELSVAQNLSGEEKLIADFYNAYMDLETINEKGISPIEPFLDEIDSIDSVEQLPAIFGNAWLTGTNTPIWSGMWYNRLNPDEYQVTLGVGGLGLPDRDYYLEESERFTTIRSQYVDHISQMLQFAGVDNPAEKAKGILELETRIAQAQWPREKRRDRDLTLNQIARADMSEGYPGFDWDQYFEPGGLKVLQLNVSQPEPVREVIAIINDTPVETWKDYLTYHSISGNASLLSEDIYLANFDFYGRTLSGQQEPRARWKRAISQMSGVESLGFAIGKVYVDRYFPETSKKQMAELVENLRTALGERIRNLDWMGEDTKKNALEKLQAFRPKIGYPDQWQSFDGLEISAQSLMSNVHNLRKFFQEQDVERELKPTDRERWGMPPQQVNAYYNSSFNEIVFPAAILQAPFFDPNADPAVNYGAIGAVIGHEMGHGFDDQGSKSDAKGIQSNWWTDADRAAFEAKTDKLAEQYSQYEPIKDNFVNGRNSLGENIGDVGGLAMAYHAYQLSLEGEEAPVIDGLTGDQRFFLAWAQVWREKRTEQSMLNQLRAGTHSPGRYRALAPRNHDAWYDAFDVQPGDELYLPPEERVRIW